MNGLVEKLVEQAGLYQGTAEGDCPVCSAFDYKKFAELIVRECAGICEKDKKGFPDSDSVKQGLADMIKQHFGVDNDSTQ